MSFRASLGTKKRSSRSSRQDRIVLPPRSGKMGQLTGYRMGFECRAIVLGLGAFLSLVDSTRRLFTPTLGYLQDSVVEAYFTMESLGKCYPLGYSLVNMNLLNVPSILPGGRKKRAHRNKSSSSWYYKPT